MSGSEFRPAAPGFEAFFMSYDPRVRRYLLARGARNEVLKEAADATMEEALRYWDRLRHHPNPQHGCSRWLHSGTPRATRSTCGRRS